MGSCGLCVYPSSVIGVGSRSCLVMLSGKIRGEYVRFGFSLLMLGVCVGLANELLVKPSAIYSIRTIGELR